MRRFTGLMVLGGLCAATVMAQTTQGLISGTVVNSVSGQPVGGAKITYTSETLASTGTLMSDSA